MKKTVLLTSSFFLLTSLLAAPKAKIAYETVAEGYPAWAGLTEANHVMGRSLCPSDMRQKATVVYFLDAAKYEEQLPKLGGLSRYNPVLQGHGGVGLETAKLGRERVVLIVMVGKLEREKMVDFIKKSKDQTMSATTMIVYEKVTCSKLDGTEMKLPWIAAFGPEPGDPLVNDELGADSLKKASGVLLDKKNVLEGWRPFYGTVTEPKAVKGFATTLAKGKPLDGLTASCRKAISSSKPEIAKEGQILFDALEQTRSDLICGIQSCAAQCPTRAAYDIAIVMKYWPRYKKIFKEEEAKLKALPDVAPLIKMYALIREWGSDDFVCKNAADAKKKEAELKKMKKTADDIIARSSSNAVQGAAAWIASEAENLAPQMASKVPVK